MEKKSGDRSILKPRFCNLGNHCNKEDLNTKSGSSFILPKLTSSFDSQVKPVHSMILPQELSSVNRTSIYHVEEIHKKRSSSKRYNLKKTSMKNMYDDKYYVKFYSKVDRNKLKRTKKKKE